MGPGAEMRSAGHYRWRDQRTSQYVLCGWGENAIRFSGIEEVLKRKGIPSGITSMEAAKRYLPYPSSFNAEFVHNAPEEGSAFAPWVGGASGGDLCV